MRLTQTMGQAIINHQGVAFMLADMAIGAEAARGLVWRSAWAKDAGERNSASTCYRTKRSILRLHGQGVCKQDCL